jgi:hypothetical protein
LSTSTEWLTPGTQIVGLLRSVRPLGRVLIDAHGPIDLEADQRIKALTGMGRGQVGAGDRPGSDRRGPPFLPRRGGVDDGRSQHRHRNGPLPKHTAHEGGSLADWGSQSSVYMPKIQHQLLCGGQRPNPGASSAAGRSPTSPSGCATVVTLASHL